MGVEKPSQARPDASLKRSWAPELAQRRFFVNLESIREGFFSIFERFFVDFRSCRVRRRHESRISKRSRLILSARLGSCVVQSLLSWPWRQQLAQNVVPVPTWRQQAADNDVQRLSKHRFIRNNTKLLQVQQNPSASKRSATWKRSKTSANASPQRFQQTLLQLNRSKTVASAAILRFQHNFFVDVYRREDASIYIYIY